MKEIEFERLSEIAGGGECDPISGAQPRFGPYPYQPDPLNPVPDPVAPDPQP